MSSVTYKGAVYPWQCDHIGHMNVMWYAGKFDEANWNFLATLRLTPTYFAEQHRGATRPAFLIGRVFCR